MVELSKKSLDTIKNFQKNEITEYHIYRKLANVHKDEMAAISIGVAVLSFGIGFLIRKSLGIEI